MSNDTIKTACEQRKFNMLFNIPPVRNEIVSPYPTFTKNQLDMRRKTEILKRLYSVLVSLYRLLFNKN